MDEKTYLIERLEMVTEKDGGAVWLQVGERTTERWYENALRQWLEAEKPVEGRYRVVERYTSFGSRSMQEFDVTSHVAYDVAEVVAEPPAVVES
jgi:hypothetical protein